MHLKHFWNISQLKGGDENVREMEKHQEHVSVLIQTEIHMTCFEMQHLFTQNKSDSFKIRGRRRTGP